MHNIPTIWAPLSTSDPMGDNGFNEMLFSIMWKYLLICLATLLSQKVLQDLTLVITELYSSESVPTFYKWDNWGSEKWDDLPKSASQLGSELGIESRFSDIQPDILSTLSYWTEFSFLIRFCPFMQFTLCWSSKQRNWVFHYNFNKVPQNMKFMFESIFFLIP